MPSASSAHSALMTERCPGGLYVASGQAAICSSGQWHSMLLCSWPMTLGQARDSRKTPLRPIWLVTAMCSIRTTNAGRTNIGSCSPDPEPRDCHSEPREVARFRSIVIKNGYNFTRIALRILGCTGITWESLLRGNLATYESVYVMHPIKLRVIFCTQSSLRMLQFLNKLISGSLTASWLSLNDYDSRRRPEAHGQESEPSR